MDTLSPPNQDTQTTALLRDLRVSTSIFCRSDMRAPWGFAVRAHGQASFHIMLSGTCWLDVDGVEAPVQLQAGDLVILATGPTHRLRSDPSAPVEWLDDILDAHSVIGGRLRYGGTGAATDLVCGVLTFEDRELAPILRALPTVAHIRSTLGTAPEWLAPLLDLLRMALDSFEPGADSVVARIADILFLQAVRSVLAEFGEWRRLFDPQVCVALRLMAQSPDEPWTVARLAAAASASRTSFADRFNEATGMPPMRYLTRLRMSLAAQQLRTSRATVAQIAQRVGYASEAALSRAFTRQMGVPPSAYRETARDGSAAAAIPSPARHRQPAARRGSSTAA